MRAPLCRLGATVAFLLLAGLSPSVAAAQSFSESSAAVADFNADGRPDLAVANHIGGRSSAAYRIDFQLSNGRSQSISFASAQQGLRVSAIDVDNDHDLDLVITPLLGRNVVGVWLNDGAGHFKPGDPDAVPSDCARLSTSTITGCPTQLAAVMPSPRRLAMAPSSAQTVAIVAGAARVPPFHVVASNRFLLSSLSPRAPPSHV
jgi:VCBS repeat protein